MNICPQCSTAYDDENIYCLADGNALIIDGPEVETVINRKFGFTFQPDPVEATQACGTCGNPNKASSRFCKKCGKAVGAQGGQFGFADYSQSQPSPTVTFQPPRSGELSSFGTQPSSYRNVVIGVLASAAVFVLALVYIVSSSSSSVSPSHKATGNSANTSSSETKSDSSTRNETFDRTYTGTIGKKNPMVLTMALKRENNILSGRADTPGSWDRLSGSIQNDGSFFLNGNERDGPLTGTYTGRINDDGLITGTYRQTNGKSSDFSASQKVE